MNHQVPWSSHPWRVVWWVEEDALPPWSAFVVPLTLLAVEMESPGCIRALCAPLSLPRPLLSCYSDSEDWDLDQIISQLCLLGNVSISILPCRNTREKGDVILLFVEFCIHRNICNGFVELTAVTRLSMFPETWMPLYCNPVTISNKSTPKL